MRGPQRPRADRGLVLERLATDDDVNGGSGRARPARPPKVNLEREAVEARDLEWAKAACAGELVQGSPATRCERVNTDSRQARAGDLFVALRGNDSTGTIFWARSRARAWPPWWWNDGSQPLPPLECGVLRVADTRQALGQLAARYRREFSPAMIAVGGSNGKTSTKELIAAVLRQKLATLWSEASFNNDVGVPATLLRLESEHQAAVVEVGTNHPGELAPLLEIIRPRFGVITNIGREHLEFFGDLAGVAAEEGTLAEALPADGKLLLNGDNEWTEALARRSRATVVRVGLGEGNDWRAQQLRVESRGMAFRVSAPQPEFAGVYRINLLGRHQVVNALFALALGAELGLDRAQARARAGGVSAGEDAPAGLGMERGAGARRCLQCERGLDGGGVASVAGAAVQRPAGGSAGRHGRTRRAQRERARRGGPARGGTGRGPVDRRRQDGRSHGAGGAGGGIEPRAGTGGSGRRRAGVEIRFESGRHGAAQGVARGAAGAHRRGVAGRGTRPEALN